MVCRKLKVVCQNVLELDQSLADYIFWFDVPKFMFIYIIYTQAEWERCTDSSFDAYCNIREKLSQT